MTESEDSLLRQQLPANVEGSKEFLLAEGPKKVPNKLRVLHYPQIPCKPFFADVKDEEQAHLVSEVLANQHLYLYDEGIIEDYSNIITVVMWEDDADGEGNGDWVDYYNDEEGMEFDEFVQTYLN